MRASAGIVRLHAQPRGDLAHDRDRDLGRRHRANIEPDRRMDARESRVGDPLLLQPREPLGVCFFEPSAPM